MKTFVYKLYNSKKNKNLHKIIDISGIIYNYCIAVHKRYFRLFGKSLNVNRLLVHITKVKKQKGKEYWSLVGSQAIQDVAERIDRAYKLFFNNLKRKIKSAPPSFKKVKRYKSFTLKQSGYKFLEGNKVKIGNKIYKYFKSRDIKGNIKTVSIKRNTLGDIYIYVVTDYQEDLSHIAKTSKIAGSDFGLKTFLTMYDGTKTEKKISPEFYSKSKNIVRKANQKLSRKKKGSNNRKKAVLDLFRKHQKIANQRKDHHFKLALELCRNYDVLAFEDLNIKGMQKLWGRKISDLGFFSFLKILESQATKYKTTIHYVDRFYPSSKTCSVCKTVNVNLELKTREWVCPVCNSHHDRDENAAHNIYMVGASTIEGEVVRLASAS